MNVTNPFMQVADLDREDIEMDIQHFCTLASEVKPRVYERDERREELRRNVKMQKRDRIDSAGIAVNMDPFSLLEAAISKLSIDLLLQPIEIKQKALNALTATEQELRDRISTIDVGVDPNKWFLFRDGTKWTPFNYEVADRIVSCFAILELGEILDDRHILLGGLRQGKVGCGIGGDSFERSHLILHASGRIRPPHMTADHINSRMTTNDSIENLRWATRTTQSENRIFSQENRVGGMSIIVLDSKTMKEVARYYNQPEVCRNCDISECTLRRKLKSGEAFKGMIFIQDFSKEGKLLPAHADFPDVEITDEAYYRMPSNNVRTIWRSPIAIYPSFTFEYKKYSLYISMVEAILGRKLLKREEVDHSDGNPANNRLENLSPMVDYCNKLRSKAKLITGVRGGVGTVFISHKVSSSGNESERKYNLKSLSRYNPTRQWR